MRSWHVLVAYLGLLQSLLVSAAPIELDKSSSVADVRHDPGTGICGSAVHFQAQAQPLTMTSQAAALLDLPFTDASILGHYAGLFDSTNLRNASPGAAGDFTAPAFPDSFIPFSADPAAVPQGMDTNVALRLRGYVNVQGPRSDGAITFGLSCNDACALRIGGTDIIGAADLAASGRATRQVIFHAPGLYPAEIMYFQNDAAAYLEWTRALSAEPEGPQLSPLDPAKFQPIPTGELFSASVGSNPGCQECGAPGQSCASGNYCGQGLCQACNVAQHCGPSCQTCVAPASLCSAGRCVECTADDMCQLGTLCDGGRCLPPTPCERNDQCPPGRICLDSRLCGSPIFDPPLDDLVRPPKKCTLDADCSAYEYCDAYASGICKPRNRYGYTGGIGCQLFTNHASAPALADLLTLAVSAIVLRLLLLLRARSQS